LGTPISEILIEAEVLSKNLPKRRGKVRGNELLLAWRIEWRIERVHKHSRYSSSEDFLLTSYGELVSRSVFVGRPYSVNTCT